MALFLGKRGVCKARAGWALIFGLLAGVTLLAPSAAKADTTQTYDFTGTFTDGVTINSGSSFALVWSDGLLNVDGATVLTSVGDFSCEPNAPLTNLCTMNEWNGNYLFNLTDGTYYLSIEFPDVDVPTGAFPQSIPLAGHTYIELLSNQTYSFLDVADVSTPMAISTPEPATLLLMLSGLGTLFFLAHKRAQA
ncbi:MAG TPA: PEP-CTERM sorting domain-containing protein [Candidatus Acidoferrum sp.]|nr:PEP-CTERM sorting domain-containing protein [Candidatus Acidoferrum sp.]